MAPVPTFDLESNPEEFDEIARRLRVLTLNALCSPVPNAKYEVRSRLRALAQHIEVEGYDVVCLQEFQERTCLFGISDSEHVEAYQEFREKMQDLGFHDQMCGPPVQGDAYYDGGVGLFSRYPFASSEMIHWVDATCWDAWASKGILYAKIEIPPEVGSNGPPVPIHVLTMHAQAKHVGWMDFEGTEAYGQVRLQQMEQLAEVISAKSQGEAVLALGDFNFDAGDADERTLHHEVLRKAKHPSDPIDVIAHTFGKHPATFAAIDEKQEPIEKFLTLPENKGNPRCLDHVYFWPAQTSNTSWGLISQIECDVQPLEIPHNMRTLEELECTHVSDHYGVSVDIGITGTDSCPNRTFSSSAGLKDLQANLEKRLDAWLGTIPIGGVAERSFDSTALVRFAVKHNLWEEAPEEIYVQYVEHKIKQGERALARKSRQRGSMKKVINEELQAGLLMLQGGEW